MSTMEGEQAAAESTNSAARSPSSKSLNRNTSAFGRAATETKSHATDQSEVVMTDTHAPWYRRLSLLPDSGAWFKKKAHVSPEDHDDNSVQEVNFGSSSSADNPNDVEQPKSAKRSARPKSIQEALRTARTSSIFVRAGRLLRAAWFSDRLLLSSRTSKDSAKVKDNDQFNLRSLQDRVYIMQYYTLVLALVGLLSGVAVNEYCWLGYIPTDEEQEGFCSDPSIAAETVCSEQGFKWTVGLDNPVSGPNGGRCNDTGGNALKGISTAMTVMLLLCIFHMYECIAIELCLRNHLEYRRPFVNMPFWEMGLLPEFVMECAVCIIHPAPGLEYFVTVEARGRISVYNCESVLVGIMFCRMYAVWRYFREWLFNRYTSKNFASRMNAVPMDSKLAIKAILDDKPFHTIALLFCGSMLVLAYLIRIAESPVNLQHIYFWNQLWLVVVTATSTGYGDLYPLSHLGRFVCFLSMMVGIILTAILVAATSSKLSLNSGEARMMRFLESESWEKKVKVAAARCIQTWWRRSLQHPRTLSELRAFRNKRRQYRKFLEATPHFGSFVEAMKEENSRIAETLEKVEHTVGVHGLPTKRIAQAVGGLTGVGLAAPVPGKVFDEVMSELAQLRKANEQLRGLVEQGGFKQHSPAEEAATAVAAGIMSSGLEAGASRQSKAEAATVASQAVEERVRRLEAQVGNFDKGMARCFAQVVRLVQGLY